MSEARPEPLLSDVRDELSAMLHEVRCGYDGEECPRYAPRHPHRRFYDERAANLVGALRDVPVGSLPGVVRAVLLEAT